MYRTPERLVAGSQLTTSAATYYTSPVKYTTTITACTLTNTTGGAITATVYLVEPGASATTSNTVLSARSLAAGETYNAAGAIGQSISPLGSLQAKASAGTSISLVASGYIQQ